MGIDIEGMMIVGERFDKIEALPELLNKYNVDDEDDFVEKYFDYCSPYFDAPTEHFVIGFGVNDVPIDSEEFAIWIDDVKEKAKEFEEITGIKAKLIGTQHVT